MAGEETRLRVPRPEAQGRLSDQIVRGHSIRPLCDPDINPDPVRAEREYTKWYRFNIDLLARMLDDRTFLNEYQNEPRDNGGGSASAEVLNKVDTDIALLEGFRDRLDLIFDPNEAQRAALAKLNAPPPTPTPENDLLLRQKNALLLALEERGLRPADFKFVWWDSQQLQDETIRVLFHEASGYFFTFDYSFPEHDRVRTSHMRPGPESATLRATANSWGEQLDIARSWMDVLKDELTEPDLWEHAYRQARLSDPSGDTDNSPFEPQELQHIAQQVSEIKRYVLETYDLTTEQRDNVEKKLDYLTQAAKRVGRYDWKNLVQPGGSDNRGGAGGMVARALGASGA